MEVQKGLNIVTNNECIGGNGIMLERSDTSEYMKE